MRDRMVRLGWALLVAALPACGTSTVPEASPVTGDDPLSVPVSDGFGSELDPSALDLLVKQTDLVALEVLIKGNSDYMEAASQTFEHVLKPYFNATDESSRSAVLDRIAFDCDEDRQDPTTGTETLNFPVELMPSKVGAVVWHRLICHFTITDASGFASPTIYRSPPYGINQLDIAYPAVTVEPAVAFQNYAPNGSYPWLGRYVQPLDRLLRDSSDAMPAAAIAGVNGGYDYRVDAWESSLPHDNICPPRYGVTDDRRGFYNHPAPTQCPMGDNFLPSCASGDLLPFDDDMGDGLVYLSLSQRAKSWRGTPFQSYNCGSLFEVYDRGALLLYDEFVYAKRTSPSKDDVAELANGGRAAVSALGAGPLLIQDGHFVYDQSRSEEGMALDNYEIGGATGAGYSFGVDGNVILHLVNIDGTDYQYGLHDWMLGLYFLSAYAHSNGALALGNGGDASLWINPALPAVQRVLNAEGDANHAYFKALFVDNGHPGIVSNCSGFESPPIACSARPVHNGLFVYAKGS